MNHQSKTIIKEFQEKEFEIYLEWDSKNKWTITLIIFTDFINDNIFVEDYEDLDNAIEAVYKKYQDEYS